MKQNSKNDIVCDVLNRTIFKERVREEQQEKTTTTTTNCSRKHTYRDRTKECISLSFF